MSNSPPKSPLPSPPAAAAAPPHIRVDANSNNGAGNARDLLSPSSDSGSRPSSSRRNDPGRSLLSPGSGNNTPTSSKPPSLYSQHQPSAELLLPPSRKSRGRRFRDDLESSLPSPGYSRRSSWSASSAGSRDSRYGLFSPFEDSRSPSRAGSDTDEPVNTQTVSEKYNVQPSAGLLLFPEDVEKDDWLHTPSPDDKDDRMQCDFFTRRGLVNLGGLFLVVGGMFMLFIGYPIITYSHKLEPSKPITCASIPNCIDVGPIPFLSNVRSGLIDPDTPDDAKTKTTQDGSKQVLVFSDEFNTDGRTFYDGDDPYFQGVDIWYGATQDLEWYSPDALTTNGGVLEIEFAKYATHGLNYQSGMLQSWNKMCFKGGTLEASISLPGRGDVSGFWPGFWAMGNLGRPGYMSTTEGMWPYSYSDTCDAGITANQSQTDGISGLPGMKLPACTCDGDDHPSPGNSRSAPEVDVLEATVYAEGPGGTPVGVISQSFQIAPFDIFWQPDLEQAEMYDYSITAVNSYQGSVFQQAISALTTLNNDWYDGKAYQKYAIEYEPGTDGHVTWFTGDEPNWRLNGAAIRANGNVGDRVMPEEPMSLVMNFGISPTFATLELGKLAALLPAKMRVDYIRIYQDEDNQIVTCDPPGYPTTDYIKQHPEAYNNPNKTTWESTGYSWPQNDFVNGC